MLIGERLVLDHTMRGCMRYNPAYRIKQYFNCYEYGQVLVYYQKSTKYGACLGPYRIQECFQDRVQRCLLCNDAHILQDKQCEHRKKEYLRIEMAKQSIPHLHKVRSKTNPPRRENSMDMRPPPKPQQRSQYVIASSQA